VWLWPWSAAGAWVAHLNNIVFSPDSLLLTEKMERKPSVPHSISATARLSATGIGLNRYIFEIDQFAYPFLSRLERVLLQSELDVLKYRYFLVVFTSLL
jgi:hypothetical protein